jgi:tetratricopeptide (TPR) repeat protein
MQNVPLPKPALAAVALVALTILAYLPSLRGEFVWDDDAHVSHNLALRSRDGLRRIWLQPGAVQQYYPLTYTTFWIEYRLWGLDPSGYRAVNILLHALNAVMVWRLLRALALPGAWAAAAIFALHPLHVESVAWISERKNVLSVFFYLGALLAWRRVQPGCFGLPATGDAARRAWHGIALALFVCALLSKTVACTLPVTILLLRWWKQGVVRRRDLPALAPMLALGLAFGLLTIWVEGRYIGARGPEWDLSLMESCLVAGRALWFYAGKLLLPLNLAFIYPRWEIDAAVPWPYLYPLSAAAVLAALWRWRHRIGRGPLTAVLCYVVTLFPALGFFPVYPFQFSFVADHFAYPASLALIALASGGVMSGLGRLGAGAGQTGRLLATVALTVLGLATWHRTHAWRDADALWQDTLRKNPGAWLAHNNLAARALDRGEFDLAILHAVEALRLNPDHADSHITLGGAHARLGRPDEAMAQYRRALELDPHHPTLHYNIGVALHEQGDLDGAIRHYREAVRLNPRHADVFYNLGLAHAGRGEWSDAAAGHRRALALNPELAEAHFQLAGALTALGQTDGAVQHLRQAVRLKPWLADARYQLAAMLRSRGRRQTDEAIEHVRAALSLRPVWPEALTLLAELLADRGEREQAMQYYREALRLQPQFTAARLSLADALQKDGRAAEALAQYREALRHEPDSARALHRAARLLATHPDPTLRDGAEAVELAGRAAELTGFGRPLVLDTLAAAHAEAGRFDDALAIARQALELARQAGQHDLVDLLQQRIELYQAGQPLRE